MALAYAVVLVAEDLYKGDQRSAVEAAQQQADKKFEQLAQDNRCTLVTRNPEPRVKLCMKRERQRRKARR